MAVSPFAFFRGGAAIMAADVARTPSPACACSPAAIAHLVNFGVFAAPDRRLVFDLDDFDETLPAPGVGRQAAGREHGGRRPRQRLRRARPAAAARGAVSAYQEVLAEFTELGFLDAW